MIQETKFTLWKKKQTLSKLYSIGILCVILITVIIGICFIQKQKFSLFPSFIISQSRYTTTNASLYQLTLVFEPSSMRCIVYTQGTAGRLGNRMFIVASAYGLARLHSCHLYLSSEIINELKETFVFDLYPFILSTTPFNSIDNNITKQMTRITKTVGCDYIRELTRPNAISKGHIFELTGFWQSYLHFSKYANELRQHTFIGTQPILEKISKFFADLYQENFHYKPHFSTTNHQTFKQELSLTNETTWIGIHVRRTDFVDVHYSSSDEYLFTAIRYFTDQYPDAHFIVASDEKSYCKNLFRNHANIFVTPESFTISDDLIALSLCEHSIVTGGTFGWWSAFLANGQVMHDRIYPSGCEKREHYYPPWFLIDGNIRANKNSDYNM